MVKVVIAVSLMAMLLIGCSTSSTYYHPNAYYIKDSQAQNEKDFRECAYEAKKHSGGGPCLGFPISNQKELTKDCMIVRGYVKKPKGFRYKFLKGKLVEE